MVSFRISFISLYGCGNGSYRRSGLQIFQSFKSVLLISYIIIDQIKLLFRLLRVIDDEDGIKWMLKVNGKINYQKSGTKKVVWF